MFLGSDAYYRLRDKERNVSVEKSRNIVVNFGLNLGELTISKVNFLFIDLFIIIVTQQYSNRAS